MTKLKAKRVVKKRDPAPDEKSKMLHVDLTSIRTEINRLVGNSAVEMVQNTINQVRDGHYQALRFLFELVGLYPGDPATEAEDEGESLATTLLARLAALEQGTTQEPARMP
jgi:hypothetical protein